METKCLLIFVERKQALFNTECRLKLLLNSIKKQYNCELIVIAFTKLSLSKYSFQTSD